MSGVQHEKLFVLAANGVHERLGLCHPTDVIVCPRNAEYGAVNRREVYQATAHSELTFDQLVLLIQLPHPLAEGGTWEWYAVVDPFVHCQPFLQRSIVEDAIPHRGICACTVRGRLDQLIARIDQLPWYVAESLNQQIEIEELLARQDAV